MLIELRSLCAEAKTNIFRRVEIAATVLRDTSWLADEFEGDEGRAMDYLETHYFSQLAGFIPLGTLVEIYRAFPTEAEWLEYGYDLRAMEIKWWAMRQTVKRQSTATAGKRRATRAEVEDVKQRYRAARTNANQQADRLRDERAQKERIIEKVKAKVAEQTKKEQIKAFAPKLTELETLRKRVRELEADNARHRREHAELKQRLHVTVGV